MQYISGISDASSPVICPGRLLSWPASRSQRRFDAEPASRFLGPPFAPKRHAAGHTLAKALQPGIKTIVVSRTIRPSDFPDVTIISDNVIEVVNKLRSQPGKDIWLFGGGVLFRAMLDARLVDGMDVGVIPVLLGGGVPMLPAPAHQTKLKLTGHKIYKTGITMLEYAVDYGPDAAPHLGSTRYYRLACFFALH
jgi:dihydrofolate reductase